MNIRETSNLCEFMNGEEEPNIKCKKCIKCGEYKSLHEFSGRNYTKNGTYETNNMCKACQLEQNKIIRKLKKYNPVPDKDYKCPGCQRTEDEIKSAGGWENHIKGHVRTVWRLDHCHETGAFRSYLCDYCNNVEGRAYDSDTLRRLADYKDYHNRKNNL